jgi:predicted transcriptional regulator
VEREEQVEQGKVEARERLARYDATGEFVADQDVEGWLKSWGASRERAAPTRRRRVAGR